MPGKYLTIFGTGEWVGESYEHPAMYTCGNNRRDVYRVYYNNPLGTEENFDYFFEDNGVPYFRDVYNYDVFSLSGGYYFEVVD